MTKKAKEPVAAEPEKVEDATNPVDTDPTPVGTAKGESAKQKKAKQTSFDVYNGAEFVRTYSVEVHGENAEDLAKEFAAHTGFTIV